MSGPLQLAAGTVLVVDETALQAGQANSTGVSNIQALQHLVEWQKVSRPRHPLGNPKAVHNQRLYKTTAVQVQN